MQTLTPLARRRARVRAKISGTPDRPRLSVKITNKNVTAQLIDDVAGQTLAYATTVGNQAQGTMSERAAGIGRAIAEAAKKKNIKQAAFDRNGRVYQGRLNALATAAREGGLEF